MALTIGKVACAPRTQTFPANLWRNGTDSLARREKHTKQPPDDRDSTFLRSALLI